MTITDDIIKELEAKKKECDAAGCTDGMVKEAECEKNMKELQACINKIKATMQTKSHYIWEVLKVIAIPAITALLLYYGAFTKLTVQFDNLSGMVVELKQDFKKHIDAEK